MKAPKEGVEGAGVVLATEADLKEKETAGAGEATDEEVLPDLRKNTVPNDRVSHH